MPLRILLVSEDWEDARIGAVKATRRLQQALRQLGHTCDVYFNGDIHPYPNHERLRFLVSPWLAWRGVKRAWRHSGPYDVIDACGGEGWWMALARRWGQFPGAVVIARTHGLEHVYYRELIADHRAGLIHKPWWKRWWYPATRLAQVGLGYRLADAGIVLNERGRDVVLQRRWKRPDRLALIPHGIDPRRWSAAPPPDAPRGQGALFSATWYAGKGITYLAEAHRLLLERGIRLPLTLLSADEPLERSAAYIRSFFSDASRPLLTVLARVGDPDQVYDYYRTHDFLILPSTYDGFGMVVTEAMTQRLPVICTTGVGASEHLDHGVNALIVPARDAAALAGAMQSLWTDPSLRRRLGEAGHAWVKDLTWELAARRTLAVYEAARAARKQ